MDISVCNGQTYEQHVGEEPDYFASSSSVSFEEDIGTTVNNENVPRFPQINANAGHSRNEVRTVSQSSFNKSIWLHRIKFAELEGGVELRDTVKAPPNVITPETKILTPFMLPLIDVTQRDIDCIISKVPGGLANIQDIYALSPLQDEILFHHLLKDEAERYVVMQQTAFATRDLLDRYLVAVQHVVHRHDALRTAFIWDQLSTPAQVVLRHASISVTELKHSMTDGSASNQLASRYARHMDHIDVRQAPLLRFLIMETDDHWILQQLSHHLVLDHVSLEIMFDEIAELMSGREETLNSPVQFRDLIAHVIFGENKESRIRFFTEMLADIQEPSLSFGLLAVHHSEPNINTASVLLPRTFGDCLRRQAKRAGVSLAAMSHLACANLVSITSGFEESVFGTVLLGRMRANHGHGGIMGLFMNTLPFRVNIDNTSVLNCIRQTHSRLARLFEHENASLSYAQQCSGVMSTESLFNTLLDHQHNLVAKKIPGVTPIRICRATLYPLILCVNDYGDQLNLTAKAMYPVEPNRVCSYMQRSLEGIANALVLDLRISIRSLEILPETERVLLIEKWNSPVMSCSTESCIHQLFEQQVAGAPDATALVYDGKRMTYAELNTRSNRLAHHLTALGVKPEQIVAMCVDRSPAMVVSVLAILKAGGAYLPLDPAHSSERMIDVLSDAMPTILIADDVGRSALEDLDITSYNVIDPNETVAYDDSNPNVPNLTFQNLAYVIYTSGSTGKPKGVMVEHCNIVRLHDAAQPKYHFSRNDVWCMVHSIAFDVSVWELWGALRYGGVLVLVPLDVARSPKDMHQFVCSHNITVLNQTPSAFAAAIAYYVKQPTEDNLRFIIMAGERLNPHILATWFAVRGHMGAKLVNMYGLTETTVHSTFKLMNQEDCESTLSPIGLRFPDSRIYLLDANCQPVPIGVTGELYIGGARVTRGYLNRPDMTRQRFLVDIFSHNKDDRMYKSGDLARYLPDGSLVFVGRHDQQIKIRGFRVELGEIEVCLSEYSAVRNAIVVVCGDDANRYLVAYLIADDTEKLVENLRLHVTARLPAYMVPSAFVRVDAFPLTCNGKLDVQKLPAPDDNAVVRRVYEPPHGNVETRLALVWQKLLKVDRISRYDSFFQLGGHSLLAVRVCECLSCLGLMVTVRDFFEHPVLANLARCVRLQDEAKAPPNVITPDTTVLNPSMLPLIDLKQADIDRIISKVPGGLANIQDIYALSSLQDGILFHHILDDEADAYVIMQQIAFETRDLLDLYLMAVQLVVDRHDVLRTAFVWEQLSTPAQVVWRYATVSVTELKHSVADGSASDQLASRYARHLDHIDIRRAPLLRFMIMKEIDGRWISQQLCHHLVVDHVSLSNMLSEITQIMSGRRETLERPVPFRDFIAQLRIGTSQESHIRFFTEMLVDIQEPSLSFGLTEVHHGGLNGNSASSLVPRALTDCLRSQAKRAGVSLAAISHLAWAKIVSVTSGSEKTVFGTVLSGRMQVGHGHRGVMGLFINTLPIRVDIDDTFVLECTQKTHSRLARLLEHEHASLVYAQRCSSVRSTKSLFNTLLNHRHNIVLEEMPGITHTRDWDATNYPVILSLDDDGYQLGLTAQVMNPVEPNRVCAYMQKSLKGIADALVLDSTISIRSLEILPEAERALLIDKWNSPIMVYPTESCIHQLFERQVNGAPDATALIYRGKKMTYKELNTRSNCLAHYLITLGVGPEQIVAICVDRSPAVVVSVLAILKAGGAYLPLDPVHSSKRIIDVLRDAMPTILLADDVGRSALEGLDISPYNLIDPNETVAHDHSNPKVPGLTSQNLAYVIYTSGSTGKPKGVMVEHRNIVRLHDATQSNYHFDQNDVWCLVHSIAFDVSVWELWGALRYGGVLVLVPFDVARSPKDMHHVVCLHEITVLTQTPSAFRAALVNYLEQPIVDNLRFIIITGERLDPYVLATWFAVRGHMEAKLVNMYGPTEITVFSTFKVLNQQDCESPLSPIGSRLSDLRIYLLNADHQPVPIGVTGELYIAGAGVTRGYLNRPDTTRERFPADIFSGNGDDRMYKSGDLARYLPDGSLMFVGRHDEQVKLRGFRIELGEVEACLAEYTAVRNAIVLVRGEEANRYIVAYVISDDAENLVENLRLYVADRLPYYMVPSAFVRVTAFPLTPNGKLDVQKLPAPDDNAVVRRVYEPPHGNVETRLALIWKELLGVHSVSRYDSFFELGGHSLLAVRVCECMSCLGLMVTVRDFFEHPILSELAGCVRLQSEIEAPPNVIMPDTMALTPSMLPLIDLEQEDIEHIISKVPGGLANIQDIYALSPLQDGILFHHILDDEADAYVIMQQIDFPTRDVFDRYLAAVQLVVDRHDVFRTAFVWEQLSTPAQVVWRHATLTVTELKHSVADGSASDQLASRYARHLDHIDIRQAPLIRFVIMKDTDDRWISQQLCHHLVVDHISLENMVDEIIEIMAGRERSLNNPIPFRHFIAHVRFGASQESHIRFFTEMLVDIQEPSLSFGLTEVHHSGSNGNTASNFLPRALNDRLRSQAQRAGVSLAAIFHLAWAKVVSVTSGFEKSVFGTVLTGRMQMGNGHGGVMGLFINTLPMRVDIDDTYVPKCTRETHLRLARLLKHEHASLSYAQRCSSVMSTTSLFNTLLNCRRYLARDDFRAITPTKASIVINYPLLLNVDDDGFQLSLTAQTMYPVEPNRVCSYMQRSLEGIANALVLDLRISIRSLEILPETERVLLIEKWNSPVMSCSTESCIHQLFEQQVAGAPDATALVYDGKRMTYAELNTRSNRLAHHLTALGVKPEQIVAMCVDRSPAMVVSVLAILKAGGAYLPLDPAHSSERMIDVLSDAMPTILIADDVGRSALEDLDITSYNVIDPNETVAYDDSNPNVPNLTFQNLAYVIYTSGSTGKPKGVMVEHCNIVRLHDAAQPKYHFSRNDVWCMVHSIAFDVSVWELWGALRYGGVLVLVPLDVARSPKDMHQFVCSHNITVLNQTPSAFAAAIAYYVKQPTEDNLRFIIMAGERLNPHILATWFAVRGHMGAKLVNMYGLTETTVHSTFKLMNQEDCESTLSPIGLRFPDSRIYLLDANCQPVPIGVTGELYIGGARVTRGYLNRPDMTRQRFLVDIFSHNKDDRMYKSGDLARYLPDGSLVFVGRHDQQIKIRGFRVELGEIEVCLSEYSAVRNAIVVVCGDDANRYLVAYLIADDTEKLVENLRLHVTARLPAYMVPSAFVRVDAFPLTCNGKLDVQKLPAPDDNAVVRRVYEPPHGNVETRLALVWQKLLKVDRISRYDSFFQLGGHSLLAVRVCECLSCLGLMVTVRDFFEHPVLANLARCVRLQDEAKAPPNVITPDTTVLNPSMLPLIDLKQADIDRIISKVPGGLANIQDIYALSSLQDGILFHHILDDEADAYVIMQQIAFETRDLLDLYLMAVQLVVDRHDVLRTAFVWEQLSTPAQVVWRYATVSVTELKHSVADGSASDQLASRYARHLDHIDIRRAPLLRFMIMKEIDGRWISQQLCHHLVVDHVSLSNMLSEITQIMSGRRETLERPVPFRDFIAQLRIGTSQESHIRFFTEMLVDIQEPSLSFGLTEVHHGGLNGNSASSLVPRALTDCLRSQAKRAGVSLAAISHLAWAKIVSVTSGSEKTVFGTVLSGRMQVGHGHRGVMGLFINTLPIRVDIDDTFVLECTQKTHSRLARLLEHEHASLVYAQRCSSVRSTKSLFNTLLNHRHNIVLEEMPGITHTRDWDATNYPVILSLDDDGYQLGLTAQVMNPVEPNRVCAYMQKSLKGIADALVLDSTISIRSLEILPEAERALLIDKWNSPIMVYPTESCIHQLFERQVNGAPDATALIYRGKKMTYKELNTRSNCLAHYLITLGVGPEQIVAICVDRSPAVVVSVLAILKAGGAYLPLDPVHSSKRIIDVLRDAMPTILLADDVGRSALEGLDISPYNLIDPNETVAHDHSNPKVPGLTSQNLAYVIYTSGSTGKPKGVMVEHRNIVRLHDATQSNYHFDQNDVWCLVHSIAFDVSVWELWGALRYGGVLVLVPFDVARSPKDMHHVVCLHEITVLTQTPSAFRAALVNYLEQPIVDNLRFIIITGERLDPYVLATWFAVRGHMEAKLVNMYGPTEITVFSTFKVLNQQDCESPLSPIGSRLSDLRIYLLNADHQPVPIGVTGELYIAGAGVTRGYLNRPDTTRERFPADIFSGNGDDRMYKSGDLARYLPDGSLMFVGRHDEQVKLRGFRIELGEVEACLAEYTAVRNAIVLVRGEEANRYIVAYVISDDAENLVENLRLYVADRLPYYMVPSAFVRVTAFPLTPNGKLDVQKLPAPDDNAVVRRVYEPPHGNVETRLALIWKELLGVHSVSRYDSFFELGGHSLLAVRVCECMSCLGLMVTVRDFFEHPILSELAGCVRLQSEIEAPPNVIMPDTMALTPSMLPLIDLEQEDIEHIISKVPGGLANIQDIYALSPLQDGILFHHILDDEADAYVIMQQIDFPTRDVFDRYLAAVQLVVDRHDVFRTAFVWEQLSTPAQVVWRHATLTVTELKHSVADGSASDQLASRYARHLDHIDIRQAPLIRFVIMKDTDDRWISQQLCHHLVVDHISLENMVDEIIEIMAGRERSLNNPIPFRHFIAHVRFGASQESHIRFFTEMLVDIQEPSLSFGLTEVHHSGSNGNTASNFLPRALNDRLRSQAQRAGVSLAAIFHLAWAKVVSVTSGFEKSVFGTVLTGRMQMGNGHGGVMGLFINTLPMRVDIDDTYVPKCTRETHLRLARLLKHEHASLSYAQRCSSVMSTTSLFNTLLNCRRYLARDDFRAITPTKASIVINYPLLLNVDDDGFQLSLTAQTMYPVEPNRVCSYMQRSLEGIANALVLDLRISIRSLEILPETERVLLIEKWNSPVMSCSTESCIHQLFEQQVAGAPDATALVYDGKRMTYAELNTRSNRLAHHLTALGVKPEQIVAMCVDRSPAMVVSVLAILKAGGAYLPLDPAHSSERMIDVLSDAMPTILIADDVGRSALEDLDITSYNVIDPNETVAYDDSNPNVPNLTFQNLAYVIYTSGSTGKPKGVMVEHCNIVRLHDAAQPKYHFSRNDVWCMVHSIAFDVSVWELWGALRYGGVLVLVPLDVARSPKDMHQFVCSHNITVLNQTPSAFAAAIAYYVKQPTEDNLRFIIMAGERLNPHILATWFAVRGHMGAKLVNMYGLTETTVHSTFKLMNQEDCESTLSPIGLRFPDSRIYLLDANCQPVPIGVTGELYIGGARVTRGYLNRPDMTRQRFLVDIFSHNKDDRMYKSGDLARYLPDGSLVFVGRHDQQIKIRGFRVELGEIEVCLSEYSAVRNAIVVVCGDDANRYLVAYLIADDTEKLVENLRLHVTARLPAYMVPSAFVRVDAFPLTCNGKLDVQKLPAPDDNAVVRRVYEPPHGNVETRLALVWQKLLKVDRISRYDSFFQLGGHSLLAVRVCECLSCLGLMVTVRDFFEHPVLANLARCVRLQDEAKAPPNVITPDTTVLNPSMLPLIDLKQADIDRIISKVPGGLANIQDIYALSSLQDGILFHHILDDEADAYVIMQQIAFETRDLLDLYLMAVQLVVDRHDVLRTAFVWEQLSTPAQVVWRYATVSVTELKHSVADGSASDQLASRYARHLDHIDIRRAPLLRFMIMKEIDGRWISQQLCHHLVVDHVSLSNMLSEITQIMSGRRETLERPVPFRDFIAQLRIGTSQESHIRFFTEMLVDIQEPSLSFGLTEVHHGGLNGNTASSLVPRELTDCLRSQAQRAGVSLAAIFHLAWAKIVSVTSGSEKSVFGTVLSGRMQMSHGHGGVMGLFINTLPIRVDIDDTFILDCTRETHSRLVRLLEHEHASLVYAQRCSSVMCTKSLFNTLLNYRRVLVRVKLPDITFSQASIVLNYPLLFEVDDHGYQLSLTAQTMDVVKPDRVLSYMIQSLEGIAAALELDLQISIRSLEILPETERELLLDKWNSPVIVYPTESCIHQLFERQVNAAPDATALIYRGKKMTYKELNTRSNCLAHYLITLGVGPEQIVAICVDRSPTVVVSILAILKAGGAYLPLDPLHSSKRIIDVLRDAMPTILLVDDVGRSALKGIDISLYNVFDPNETVAYDHSNPNVPGLTSQNLAYVIYTSGSTGKPKGVMVEHRNIVRLHDAAQSNYHFDKNDVWCLVHSTAFDVSVWELWGALRYGGVLVLVPSEVARSPKDMHQLVCYHKITVLNQTPSAFRVAVANYVKQPIRDNLRFIIMGGEKLDPYFLGTWFAVRGHMKAKLVNMYGLTETTVHSTVKLLNQQDCDSTFSPIGSRLSDLRIYLLNAHRQPVPIGVTGELYIGGAGVTRGYLNRPDITRERFLVDTFSHNKGNRMYKSGDLARFLPNGRLVFLGRYDEQVKIRGFRIEPGEIEACLFEYPAVRNATIVVCGDEANRYLVAYVIVDDTEKLVENLRLHVAARLPSFMVPSAFVRVDTFPLTCNGKLDVQKLPAPDDNAVARRVYEPPHGHVETRLALIWEESLNVARISRNDSFFELGGHSLLAVRVCEYLSSFGLKVTVQDCFKHPILADLAGCVRLQNDVEAFPNVITPDTTVLTPSMLPLIDLKQADIDRILSEVPGGLANIQDIYALSPLQDGILFHHILDDEADAYVIMHQIAFETRDSLDRYLMAVQLVVDRHDILRTAFLWQHLSSPAQVVWRQATVSVIELKHLVADSSVSDQLALRYTTHLDPIDIRQAPLLRLLFIKETDNRWILQQLSHHLVLDHVSLEMMFDEIAELMSGSQETLLRPVPFRDFIAHVRFGTSQESHIRFFTEMLVDIQEPSLSFGIARVHHSGSNRNTARILLPRALNDCLRSQAKRIGVSLAAITHLAWAKIVSVTSGSEKSVFATVLFGRLQAGHGHGGALGLFINTVPIRLDIDDTLVPECTRKTHSRLARLIQHEHASLAYAQRCSSVRSTTLLFNTLLNHRHNMVPKEIPGMTHIRSSEATNYPVILSVDDDGHELGLAAQTMDLVEPNRVCSYMQRSLEGIADALVLVSQISIRSLEILPEAEQALLIDKWNSPVMVYPTESCIHQLFERQVSGAPDATALIYRGKKMTYTELNTRSNRLAHYLIALGVGPERIVAMCVDRSPAIVVSVLAILKAGGAYLPLDPAHSSERIIDVLRDAMPTILLTDDVGQSALEGLDLSSYNVIDPNETAAHDDSNPIVRNLASANLAYVIYTSGSTGKPKGVMVEHRHIVRLHDAAQPNYHFDRNDVWCLVHSIAFDVSVWELWGALRYGGVLVLVPFDVARSPTDMYQLVCSQNITVLNQTPTAFAAAIASYVKQPIEDNLRFIIMAGERLNTHILATWFVVRGHMKTKLVNMYGLTETTVHSTIKVLNQQDCESTFSPIGLRLSDSKIYLLNTNRQPVPIGVTGELYVGGAGVTRGYLNRPDITRERFLEDIFSQNKGDRMYKSGDLARYLPDGSLVFVGRHDQQVKIRGFRIELGEIEACLSEYSAVRHAIVVVCGDEANRYLVAYVIADDTHRLVENLRLYVAARLPFYMVPSAVVPVDAFPFTCNGKLDFQKLPAPGDNSVVRRIYEPPHGKVETSLAFIWEELLGADRVSRHDSFFDLGGNSILAVRMVNLAVEHGIPCTMSDLFQTPVLANFAKSTLERLSFQQRVCAIPVRAEGTDTPLFFVPSGANDISYAFAIARFIRPGFPIFVIPWPILYNNFPISALEDFAMRCISLIKEVQSNGPYQICGYSSGGILGYCIAELLLASGDLVSFLGLIDTVHPLCIPNSQLLTKNMIVEELLPRLKPEFLRDFGVLIQKTDELNSIEVFKATEHMVLSPSKFYPEIHARFLEEKLYYHKLARDYLPHELNITIHQFYAMEETEVLNIGDMKFSFPSTDASLGWSANLPKSVIQLLPIPGNHTTMVDRDENRAVLGHAINLALDST